MLRITRGRKRGEMTGGVFHSPEFIVFTRPGIKPVKSRHGFQPVHFLRVGLHIDRGDVSILHGEALEPADIGSRLQRALSARDIERPDIVREAPGAIRLQCQRFSIRVLKSETVKRRGERPCEHLGRRDLLPAERKPGSGFCRRVIGTGRRRGAVSDSLRGLHHAARNLPLVIHRLVLEDPFVGFIRMAEERDRAEDDRSKNIIAGFRGPDFLQVRQIPWIISGRPQENG